VNVEAVRLDGHRPHPPRPQCLRHQHQAVVETGADDDPFRVRVHAAGPRQIVRDDGAQFYPAEGVAAAEGIVRRRGQCAAGGGEPLRPGERREVRRTRHQAVRGTAPGRPGTGRGGRGPARFGPPGHPGPGPLLRGEPALGDQFAVGVGHGVTGDAQVGGERAGGGQPGAGHETPRAHSLPQSVHEPGAQPGSVQFQMQVRTERGRRVGRRIGPRIRHRNGPYPCATGHVAS
jgi:hypothetical protein